MAKSTTKRASGKPRKPSPDFPLFPHATGRWAKKIRGRFQYFGKVADDPKGEAALALWLEQKDDLLAGRTPRPKVEGFTLRELLDRFMVSKRDLLNSGEINPRTFADLYGTCKRLGDVFGLHRPVVDLAADDFERLRRTVAKTWGPLRLGNEIQHVRSIFKFGYEAGLIVQPIRFGPGFKKPSRKVLRLNRASKPARMLEPAEIRAILDSATVPMRAMVLLGVNAGLGNNDIANLPLSALDLKRGWIDYPRPKTGVPRRCALWAETVAAIQAALEQRPTPKASADAGFAFITMFGAQWATVQVVETEDEPGRIKLRQGDSVGTEFRKVLLRLGLKRPGVGFYTLRHVFRTIADSCHDQPAVNSIMGHVDDSMAANYRERIDDDRLKAVVDYVHTWLFPVVKSKRSK
jgi:integrase